MADGAIERYKARLVAKGFTQREGISFFQTFSPVIGFDVMRTVLATAAHNVWDIGLLDFTQAYLNASLEEAVWLENPDGSIVKARKAIYGLKQSALEWYKELRGAILEAGWSSSHHHQCLYYRRSDDGCLAIMLTYVDDCLLTGDYAEEIERMRTQLLGKYKGRDLGTPEKMVGVTIRVDEMGTTLHQQRFAQSIVIDGMGSMDVHTASSSLDPGMDLTARQNKEELDTTRCPYANILGNLMFLAVMTRPDLSNSVRELTRRAASPCVHQRRGLQHVLRYLAGTTSIGLHYPRGLNNDRRRLLAGYADSDLADDWETRRSVTGYLLLFNGSPIVWRLKF
ncbi:unnamed protein product [Discosporangium mesarthrocarpum]